MKRKAPNSTLDQFFTSSFSKQPVSSDVLSKQSKGNLVIVKATPQKKVLKISIPSLSDSSMPSDEEFNAIWDTLKRSIDILFAGNFDQLNFSRLHNEVEYFCRFKSGKALYDLLIPEINNLSNNFLTTLTADLDIHQISKIVTSFEENISNLRKIFFYLDRTYIFANRIEGFLSLTNLIHNIIRKLFLEHTEYIDLVVVQIKLQINIFRCIQSESNESLSNVLNFMNNLGLYESHIEKEILIQTQEFYQKISSEFELMHFLEWLSIAQTKERELLEAGVKPSTIEMIFKLINQTSLVENQEMLFGEEFTKALLERNDQLIIRLFSFFDNNDIRSIFSGHLCKYFTGKAEKLLEDHKITDLIYEYKLANDYVKEVFPENKDILSEMRKLFDSTFESKSEFIAKLLAKYFNEGNEIRQEDIEFFKLNHTKDIFEASYFFLLSQRILAFKHVNINREKNLISRIKEITGPDFTDRLQNIIEDLEKSQKASVKSPSFDAVAINYRAFSNEIFNDDVIYPERVQAQMKAFYDKFVSTHKQITEMQMHWMSKFATVEGQISHTKVRMTGDQALILLAIQQSTNGKATISTIKEKTGINDETIKDNLEAMRTQEAGFIVQHIGTNTETNNNGDDEYIINPNPTFPKKKKIKFPSTAAIIAQKEKDATDAYVEVVKSQKLECQIILKMKLFKLLSLNDLYNKVSKDLSFVPDTKKFASTVSSLVERGFLEKTNDRTYRYIP
ncbi:Cullin family protein [Tritrichomonas foetus]|uniref:Cullin family protein n=1 Tax=Tritrichomonas foetus TaxID=1144522 RepID=A0A1J4K9S6_9EUKA|nr:Cullin family protein [Tritrichomonas foetus]|eukprot:OHT08175.1 Cullin family protein [Tritrichomonas foetus]